MQPPADLSKSKEGPCRPQHANDLIITHLTTNYPHRSIKRAPPYKPLMAPLCRCTDKEPFLTNHLRSPLAVRIMQNPDVTNKKLKKRHIDTAGTFMKGFLLPIVSTIIGYTPGSQRNIGIINITALTIPHRLGSGFFSPFFFFSSRVPAAGNDDDDLALAIVTASKYALRPKVEVSYERMPRSESERLKNGLRR